MRILFSLLDAGLGGGQTVALSVAERLVTEEHSIGVMVPAPGVATERFRAIGAAVHTADLHSLRRVSSVWQAARNLREYDVLYSHTSIPGEILGDLAARIASRRHVIHRHTLPHLSPQPMTRTTQATLYRLLMHGRQVIAVAPHVANGVVALGVARRNVTVISNGVDLDSLPDVPPIEPGARVTIGVLGRADPQKGMDVFTTAVGMIQEDDLGARFVIGVATGGFPEYEHQVLDEAHRVGIEVATPGPNGPAFLAGLDIVAMPSRWEGSPLVLFEALALGKPVVASDIPGIAEVIAGENVGLLVPPDDSSALADGIRAAMMDGDRRRRWSEKARRLASRYTREEAVTRAARIVTETPD